MKNYEGLFLLKSDLEKEEIAGLYQKIQDNIKKYKGDIENAEEWGKRFLAYKIGKHKEGLYYLLKFKMEPAQIANLNADLKLNESILRAVCTER